jgi:hypothetical protein
MGSRLKYLTKQIDKLVRICIARMSRASRHEHERTHTTLALSYHVLGRDLLRKGYNAEACPHQNHPPKRDADVLRSTWYVA